MRNLDDLETPNEQHIRILEQELHWEREVVQKDLESKLSNALSSITTLAKIIHEHPISQEQAQQLEYILQFRNENINYVIVRPENQTNHFDNLPF